MRKDKDNITKTLLDIIMLLIIVILIMTIKKG